MYVRDEASSLERPGKELKALKKIFLQPSESQEVELMLDETAFQYYNDTKKKCVIERGKFLILVGNSSKSIKLTGEVIF